MRSRQGTPLEESYFVWLCKPLDKKWDISFTTATLRQLHRTEFKPFIANDKNRAADGKELREEYLYRHPVKSSAWELDGWMALETSVLEVLIALADRAAYQSGDTMADWLFAFLCNLGLDESPASSKIRNTLQRFNERTYSRDGLGGLFPLRNPVEDQRRVELWYQMSAYIIENYDGRGVDAGFPTH